MASLLRTSGFVLLALLLVPAGPAFAAAPLQVVACDPARPAVAEEPACAEATLAPAFTCAYDAALEWTCEGLFLLTLAVLTPDTCATALTAAAPTLSLCTGAAPGADASSATRTYSGIPAGGLDVSYGVQVCVSHAARPGELTCERALGGAHLPGPPA